MKGALMITILAMCMATAAHAAASDGGTIRFVGSVYAETCTDAGAVAPFPGAVQYRADCRDGATSKQPDAFDLAHTVRVSLVSTHTGIAMLDYFSDYVHAKSVAQVRLVTRSYD